VGQRCQTPVQTQSHYFLLGLLHFKGSSSKSRSRTAISIKEVFEAAQKGSLDEAFGTGTAAVISPIGELHWNGENIQVNSSQVGEVSSRLYHTITGIQTGRLEDHREWTIRVCEA